jgi:hypothetical protein
MHLKAEIDTSDITVKLFLDDDAKGKAKTNSETPYDFVRRTGWRQVLDSSGPDCVVLLRPFGLDAIHDGDREFWRWLAAPGRADRPRIAVWLAAEPYGGSEPRSECLLARLEAVDVTVEPPPRALPGVDAGLSSFAHSAWRRCVQGLTSGRLFRIPCGSPTPQLELDVHLKLTDLTLHARCSGAPDRGYMLHGRVVEGHFFAVNAVHPGDVASREAAIEAGRACSLWAWGLWQQRLREAIAVARTAFEESFTDDAERCECCAKRLLRPYGEGVKLWRLELRRETSPPHYALYLPGRRDHLPIRLEHMVGATLDILRRKTEFVRDIDEELKDSGVQFRNRARRTAKPEPRLKSSIDRLKDRLLESGVCGRWIADTFLERDGEFKIDQ